MTRLLKITLVLMGLLLLTVTLGGILVRPADNSEKVPLMAEQDLRQNHLRFFQIWPGVDRALTITPYDPSGYQFWGVDAAGEAAYVAKTDVAYQRLTFYQLHSSHPRPIVENAYAGTVYTSSNFAWVLYAIDQPDGGWEYWAVNLHTGQRWPVSQLIQPRIVAFRTVHVFSSDEQWLYITAQEPDPPRYEVVAMRLSDGVLVEVTNGHGGTTGVHLQGQVGDWVIFDRGEQMFRIRRDGSDFGPLFDPPISQSEDEPSLPPFVFMAYPSYHLALIQQNLLTLAVDVEAGKLVWQHGNLRYGFTVDDTDGWIILTQEVVSIRLHLPTGEIQPMPEVFSAPATYRQADSSDGRWTLYEQQNPSTGVFAWWCSDWASGQSRLILADSTDYIVRGISPDGQWIWAADNRESKLKRVRVSDGYTEIMFPGGEYRIVGWMRPFVRTWQPAPLMLIALALITLSILPRRLLQLLHRSPSSYRGH
ncbi:MAG: hypothetical protein BroJett018_26230 [Chloroflexota bacterium]|nr:MAG: hypothetical protein BroJett018_26230 [Chloroflexota bacterium]